MSNTPWGRDEFRLILGRSRIDFDPAKEATNKKKHGYSLSTPVAILSKLLLPVPQPPYMTRDASTSIERRHEHMAVEKGRVVFFVTTMREDETVRVISLRRANKKERQVFRELVGFAEQTRATDPADGLRAPRSAVAKPRR